VEQFVGPLVSIVIPVFNRANLIKDCVDSALSQTYSNIEIIIYDNCSTDDTWAIVQQLAESCENIKVFQQIENVGPVRNWYSAISMANGELVKVLFSDDLIYPKFLAETVPQFTDNIGFVTTSFDMGPSSDDAVISNDWPGVNGVMASATYIDNALSRFAFLVSPGAAIFRTSDVIGVFEEEIPSPRLSNFKAHGAGPDLLIFLKIAAKYPSVYKCDQSLCLFRSHSDSQTNRMNRAQDGLIQSSYMQARVYFAKHHAKRLLEKTLGKAMFVELIQNRNRQAISLDWLVGAYLFDTGYSRLKIYMGFMSAVNNAFSVLVKRVIFRKEKI